MGEDQYDNMVVTMIVDELDSDIYLQWRFNFDAKKDSDPYLYNKVGVKIL